MVIPVSWNFAGTKHHFVAEIDDSGLAIVVSKFWQKRKRRWEYVATIKAMVEYQIGIEAGG